MSAMPATPAMPATREMYAARDHRGLNRYHEPLDWGPARHDPSHPLHPGRQPTSWAAGLDPRDAAAERPDDN